MSSYTDLERIRRLQDVLGSDASDIVASMLVTLTTAIERVEAAVSAGELDAAAKAAHAARNDAMTLGARQLLEALTDLEAAGRDHDNARVSEALMRVRDVWPPTRDELASAADPT
jgi:hypothetical protein